jgi:hypothetical protein
MNEIIELWKKLDITKGEFIFSCGGDSMNETEFRFWNSKNEEVEDSELENYFESEVYEEVDFYEVSDGHYMGEFGTVIIVLEEDDDEPYFSYDKESQSEYEERLSEVMKYELTDDEVKFITEKVQSIVGGEDGKAINYKGDCLLSDEEVELSEKLLDNLWNTAGDYEFENADGEPQEWFVFTTSIDEEDEIIIEDNKLSVEVQRTYYQLKED